MTVNNTKLTLENLKQVWNLTRNFISISIKSTPIWKFITSPDVLQIWNVPMTNSKKAFHLEVTKGTTSARDSDGTPTGLNFNSVDTYENLAGLENVNANYTLPFQDLGIIESEIDTLLLVQSDFANDVINDSQFVEQMTVTQYGQIIQSRMIEAVKADIEGKFVTFAKALFTDNFFDTETPLRTANGTIHKFINIVSAEFTEANAKSLLNLSVLEKSAETGRALGAPISLQHAIVDNDKVGDAITIIDPAGTQDANKRTILNAMGNKVDIIPAALGNLNVIMLGVGHGVVCLMNSLEPIITIEKTSNGSYEMNVDSFVGFALKHGQRIYAFKK